MRVANTRDHLQLFAHLITLAFVACLAFSLTTWQGLPQVLNQVIDDAFYFSVPAYNISQGNGSTFDGIHLTNGYHPLWLLVQIPLFYAIPAMGESTFRIVLGIQVSLAVVSTLLLYWLVWLQFKSELLALCMACIWIVSQRGFLITGMETPLYALTLLAVLLVWFVYFSDSGSRERALRHYVFLGLLCGLTAMARLDGAILGAVLGFALLWQWWTSHRQMRFRELLAFGLPFAMIMLIYFAINQMIFGLAMPISGNVKFVGRAFRPGYTDFSIIGCVRLLLWAFENPMKNILVISGLFVYPVWLGATWLMARVRRNYRCLEQSRVLAPFYGFALTLLVYYVAAFYDPKRSIAGWYYLPARIMGVLTIALMLATVYRTIHIGIRDGTPELIGPITVLLVTTLVAWEFGFSPLRIGTAAIMLVLVGGTAHIFGARSRSHALLSFALVVIVIVPTLTTVRNMSRYHPTNHTAYYDAAVWIRENTAQDTVIAAYNAGTMGFFSSRRVINLDGYANSKSFRKEIRQLGTLGYLVENNVQYVVDCFPMATPYENVHPYRGYGIERLWVSPKDYGSCTLQVYHISREGLGQSLKYSQKQ